MERLTIGKIADRAGAGVETVRFYERKGLVPEPPRTDAGYRQYPPDAADRIRFIRRAQEIGFSLGETGELLALRVDPASDCGDVRARAQAKLEEVEAKIRDLERMRAALAGLVRACVGHGPVRECAILDALEPGREGSCGSS